MADLRRAGRLALSEEGFAVETLTGRGFLPGARVEAVRGDEVSTVAIRATHERFVGFSRHPNGHWRTLETVDLVVVATPLKQSVSSVEVLAFEAARLRPLFDAALEQSSSADSFTSMPTFIPLDEQTKKEVGHKIAGLKNHSLWFRTVKLATVRQESNTSM